MARKNDWSKQELESSVMVYLEMLHKQEMESPLLKNSITMTYPKNMGGQVKHLSTECRIFLM